MHCTMLGLVKHFGKDGRGLSRVPRTQKLAETRMLCASGAPSNISLLIGQRGRHTSQDGQPCLDYLADLHFVSPVPTTLHGALCQSPIVAKPNGDAG